MAQGRFANARWLAWPGWVMWALMAATLVWLGEPNGDEGFYLYASRLVYQGQQPYRDFTFLQTPLLPYVYGLPQRLFGPGIVVGRLTSAALTALGLAALGGAAHKRGGRIAQACTILFASASAFGLYYAVIVKTYALVLAFFGLTLWLLTADIPEEIALPVAVLASLGSAAARLSAAPFCLPVIVHVLCVARHKRTRALIVTVIVLCGVTAWGLLEHWGPAAVHDVLTCHLARWSSVGSTWADKIGHILQVRIPSLFAYLAGLGIASAALGAWWLAHAHRPQRLSQLVARCLTSPWYVYSLGLLLFCAAHMASGGWYIEYLAPAVIGVLPIIGVMASEAIESGPSLRAVVLGMMAALMCTLASGIETIPRARIGQETGLQSIGHVAEIVRAETAPDDPLLTMAALWVAVETGRPVLPGLSMGASSFTVEPREIAERYHTCTGDMLVEMVAERQAKIVILTASDWGIIEALEQTQPMQDALAANYAVIYNADGFGQGRIPVWVHRLRE